jgi:hypothetical protein|nr:hypothetical protein [Kofleriaceae bacterium]
MEIEVREALALGDRAAALEQLLPGSEDHDYYRALHAQQAGRLDDVDAILGAWVARHGRNQRYQRLRVRQLLCRLAADPARAADDVRDEFHVSLHHEPEVAAEDPRRPTRLAPGAFDGARILADAAARANDLADVTDEGLYELVGSRLDASRRRALLDRLDHTPHPALVAAIAADLAARGANHFGSSRIHGQLTLAQLTALADVVAALRTADRWILAVVQRMRPPSTVDLDTDRAARDAYLGELWAFVRTLEPTSNSLKSHVLYHLVDAARRRGDVPAELFADYLAMPRRAPYVGTWAERATGEHVARTDASFADATGLADIHDDVPLVRDVLHRQPALAERVAQWLERGWLEVELATAALLHGTGDAGRATGALGPTRAAALRDRIDLAWCAHNPTRFAAGAPVALDVDVKNVGELVVKVFRIDPLAYFQLHKREVDTDLDLDGLAATSEQVLRFAEPPIRRVRRRVELPACARAGTYVVDLIGNGMSSRALVRKGRLRFASRVGAQGRVVTIVDDAGAPRPDARAWLGDREYVPDARGVFVVPFSTAPGATPMLLAAGDIATAQQIELVRETYALELVTHVDRQALAADRPARAIARVQLSVAGMPASVALLERATWDVTLVDRAGVSVTKSQPLALSDGDATVLEWPLGDDVASVTIGVTATVKVISEQREQQLASSSSVDVAAMHGGVATEALYLARTAAGWVMSALGKSGEPRARRPVTVGLMHRWTRARVDYELATDDRGRIELGELAGVVRVSATLGGTQQVWQVGDPAISSPATCMAATDELVVPVPPTRDAADVLARMSIVEVRAGVPVRHAELAGAARVEAGAIFVRGLTAGDYWVRAPGCGHFALGVIAGARVADCALDATSVIRLSLPLPTIASLELRGDHVAVRVSGATADTRVHAIATRFAPARVSQVPLGRARPGAARVDRERPSSFVSGRELGDEYRYILERRAQPRYPGLLLDRPSLLLNPWSRRTTSTGVQHARAGGSFGASPPMGAPYASAPAPIAAKRAAADDDAWASYDFLAAPPAVLANLAVAADGTLTIPVAALGDATYVSIVVDDLAGTTERGLALAEQPVAPRDLRLRVALDPARHAQQTKQIAPLRAGATLVVEDMATATVHLVDSVARAHGYLLALRGDDTLREFAWIATWHELAEPVRRERYSKYACHELHLFLYFHDRAWFDAVVRPYLANKRVKTFVDDWLLDADLAPYLAPARLQRLNAAELALLARKLPAAAAVARQLADDVSVQPPDPARDARLIDTLLGAALLDGASELAEAQKEAFDEAFATQAPPMAPAALGRAAPAPMMAMAMPGAAAPQAPKQKKSMMVGGRSETRTGGLAADVDARELEAPMFRAQDKTQEWAETQWWRRTPADSGPQMIAASRLWRDVARGDTLSPNLGLAATSFAEAMVALAVTALPFVAVAHRYDSAGPRMTVTVGSDALVGSSQLVYGELVAGGAPLVVGQTLVRADDRTTFVDGEQVDNYVTGPLAAGVVYVTRVVVANPTSARQRVTVLVQLPRGSIPVSASKRTHAFDVQLEAYGTHGYEASFYVPQVGTWPQFPAHVSRGGRVVAAAPAVPLEVIAGGAAADPASWPQLSQHGALPAVVAALATANLAAIDVDRLAWRMRDRAAYDAIVSALEARHTYRDALWGYALLHRDPPRIAAWLRARGDQLLRAGPVLDGVYDGEALGSYEHLELAPLTNARAHRLGAQTKILNDGLRAQYDRFLEHVAHRATPTADDQLALAGYLLAQDRVAPALAALASVGPARVADRMQHDYLAAYAACITGDVARARALATPWRELPVERWRRRFEALLAMLDELTGASPAITDPQSRDQQQSDLAARQPAFELAVDRDGVTIRQQHVAALELRYFEMDVELLFSRQPFVQSDVSRFSFIEPGHREHLTDLPAERRVPWPEPLRGRNVVVEAVGAGLRRAKVHYANDLATTLAHQYGQLRAQRASDGAPLPATYVKVYARKRGTSSVLFYKDGYTDLRGWFDYATLSTTDLDDVDRFALLVCSDSAGATILEATPPQR